MYSYVYHWEDNGQGAHSPCAKKIDHANNNNYCTRKSYISHNERVVSLVFRIIISRWNCFSIFDFEWEPEGRSDLFNDVPFCSSMALLFIYFFFFISINTFFNEQIIRVSHTAIIMFMPSWTGPRFCQRICVCNVRRPQ